MNRLLGKLFLLAWGLLMIILLSQCSLSRQSGEEGQYFPATMHDMKQEKEDTDLLKKLLGQYPQLFDTVLKNKDDLRLQIIYTQIDRDKKGRPVLTDHYYNVDTGRYFYPASTVKLPVAALALQRLNELKKKRLDKYTTMITEEDGDDQTIVVNDPSSADGRPTIAQYIKKILLVSDNDAFNRLYEFLGQEYINTRLHGMGYKDIQILHRLSIFLNETQNRHTNPIRFVDTSGKTIYAQPAVRSQLVYTRRDEKIGKGFIEGDSLVNQPFDFSTKNKMSLPDLHNMVRSIIFPRSVPKKQRFGLTKADYRFLLQYMSMYPRESAYPFYDSAAYPDTYVKKFLCGIDTITPDPDIRIFNKTGTAYGFLIDASFIVDFSNKIEFMLTAVIYCNSNGILNDGNYDYDKVGYPFLQNLGKVIYEYELQRKRKVVPDLSDFRFDYSNQPGTGFSDK